jgi:phosphatidylserine decarboxylase
MSMLSTFLKPMHPEGWRFVGLFALASLVLFLVWEPLGWLGVGLTVWCYYFFRDPRRSVPLGEALVLAPADGVVSDLRLAVPPEELGLGPEPLPRLSIFMSVFDVHVNRAPVAGRLEKMAYRKGKFLNASLDKASEENERMALLIRLGDGRAVVAVQIAGLVARRIVPFAAEGDRLMAGARIGLIRFGSRLDVYLPDGVAPLVAVGQAAVAGETVIADLASTEPARVGEVR